MKNRKQKVVISNKTSSSDVVTASVPKGSVDGPFLFNLLIDLILFFYTTVLSHYADVSNLDAIGIDTEKTKRVLVEDFQTVID